MTSPTEAPSCFEAVLALGRDRAGQVVHHYVAADGSLTELTGAQLSTRSRQLARALAARGVGEGDLVGIGLRNSPQFTMTVLASWLLGAVPVPVRWDVPDWELQRLKEVVDPRVYLGPEDVPWIDGTAELEVPELSERVSPFIQGICSSGSTGTPKVILTGTPARLYPPYVTPAAQAWMPVARPQTILALGPMYHANQLMTVHNMLAGDELVVMEKFDGGLALEAIERHRVTTFTATPTMLQRMADHPDCDKRDLSSLVWILQGAAPMPVSLAHRWFDLIGPEKVFMAYGQTEGIGITGLRGDEYLLHEGSVGRGLRGTEVLVLDDERSPVPAREIGEVYMRSPSYGGSTYLGRAPQMPATQDGFRTVGDMGYVDEDGYLYIVDRRVDLIITGGANVFPAEVETALVDHPAIADIVVVGLKDEQWGRRVHAIIEPADPERPPTLDDVVAYARSRLLPYKVPKSIEIIEEMPRSAASKVNRSRLVEVRGG
jgi:bile acid-coenzyme A ligase